uniref:Uncharacterized protein n=1 Tax=Plectus sambesii TaxID=2011161 RepID=A0A914WZ38_9BILA
MWTLPAYKRRVGKVRSLVILARDTSSYTMVHPITEAWPSSLALSYAAKLPRSTNTPTASCPSPLTPKPADYASFLPMPLKLAAMKMRKISSGKNYKTTSPHALKRTCCFSVAT